MRQKKVCLAWLLAFGRASAAVQQIDGAVIPRSPTQAELAKVANTLQWNAATLSPVDPTGKPFSTPVAYGQYYSPPQFPQFVNGDAITLEGLFKWRKEAIDWQADARAPAGGFVPKCPLTVEPVLIGGSCRSRLGWYNVPDPSAKAPPDASDVFPLLPQGVSIYLQCKLPDGSMNISGFCPLAWDNRFPNDLSKPAWLPYQVTADVLAAPEYKGGAIGFALVPDEMQSGCGGPRYSVRAQNPRDAADQPLVQTLVYSSRAHPGDVYLAFDDGVNSAADRGDSDGDFNDYVVYVSGCFDSDAAAGAGNAGGAGAANAGAGNAGATNGGAANAAGSTSAGRGGSSAVGGGGANSAGSAGSAESGATSAGASPYGLAGFPYLNLPDDHQRSEGCSCTWDRPSHSASSRLALGTLLALGLARRRRRPVP